MSKWSKPGTNLRAIPLHISYIYPNEHKTITIMDIKTGHRIHMWSTRGGGCGAWWLQENYS